MNEPLQRFDNADWMTLMIKITQRGRLLVPRMDPLEARRLLSASLSPGGTLSVIGTAGGDRVVVSADNSDSTQIVVYLNGERLFFPVGRVKRGYISLGDGNDRFIIDGTYGLGNGSVPREIYGGKGDDSLGGSRLNDKIFGEDGNDTLSGRPGEDSLYGGQGNDIISGGDGSDQLDGEGGNDYLEGSNDSDTCHGGAGDDFACGINGDDVVYGDAGNDSVSGCDGNDTVYGGDGNDVVDGLFGSDVLYGGNGNDILSGNLGNDGPDRPGDSDQLFGEDGNDDFDPLDSSLEVRDRTAGDQGRNTFVPSGIYSTGISLILATRSFT